MVRWQTVPSLCNKWLHPCKKMIVTFTTVIYCSLPTSPVRQKADQMLKTFKHKLAVHATPQSVTTSFCWRHESFSDRCCIVSKTLWSLWFRSRLLDDHMSVKMNSEVSPAKMPLKSAAVIMAALWNRAGHYIFRPHCSTTYVDAAYSYRPSSVVCRSVCHTSEPCKNGCTDQAAVWVEDLGGPGEPCIRWGPDPPVGMGKFLGENGHPIVKYRDTLRSSVQRLLNRWECRLGCELGWAVGIVLDEGP